MGQEGAQALNYAMKLIYLLECGFLSRFCTIVRRKRKQGSLIKGRDICRKQ